MKVSKDCFSCLIDQGVRAIEFSGIDERNKGVMVEKVRTFLNENFHDDNVPARLGTDLQELVFEMTGEKDPLKKKKRRANHVALSLFDKAKKLVEDSDDRLRQAIRIALAGNLIDFAVYHAEIDSDVLEDALRDPLIIDDCDRLESLLQNSKTVFYICDNAGEIVFDKILIEELIRRGLKVTASVKSGPIVNDATLEDAEYVGLTSMCKVISSGAATIGTNLNLCSKDFLEKFEESDIIVSKGQANFETLHEIKNKNIVFMLKAKCETIARYLDVEKNSSIVLVKD